MIARTRIHPLPVPLFRTMVLCMERFWPLWAICVRSPFLFRALPQAEQKVSSGSITSPHFGHSVRAGSGFDIFECLSESNFVRFLLAIKILPAKSKTEPSDYKGVFSFYPTTRLTSFPGITTTLIIFWPSMCRMTFSLARARASSCWRLVPAGTLSLARSFPLICTGISS